MDHVINWIWQGALVAGLTTVVLRLMERTRAQARYVVCWLALAAIASLPVLPGGVPSTLWVPAWAGAFSDAMPEMAAAPLVAPVAAMPSAWWTSTDLALLAGGLWLLIAIGRLAADIRATRRSRAACRAFPPALESTLRCWNTVRGGGRPTVLALSADVRAASVIGGGRPIVAVAPVLLSRLTPDELDRAVIHEWAHVQRRDDLIAIAHAVVRVIAGWHPAVWWLERRMLIEREIACDETAVAVTGCPKRYAACLTVIAAFPAAARERAGAMGMLSTPSLSRRVARILSRRATASRAGSAGAAAAAVMVLSALSLTLANHRLVAVAAVAPQAEVASFRLKAEPTGGGLAEATHGAPAGATTAGPAEATDGAVAESTDGRPAEVRRGALTTSVRLQADAAGRVLITQESRAQAWGTSLRDVGVTSQLPAVDPLPSAASSAPGVAPRRAVERGSHTIEPLPVSASLPVIDAPAFSAAPGSRPAAATAPWTALADAGVAVGRGSQTAGVATAKFFTRVGRKIAGSF